MLRGLDNAGFGQLGRFDGTSDGGAKPGPLCAPWLYSTIVSIPRMLLAIVEAEVIARGSMVLGTDTDSLMLAASPSGGEIVTTLDGREARCLSWEESDEVFSGFDRLAVDDHDGLWEVVREIDGVGFLGRSLNAKRYALGYFDNSGRLVVVKSTEHNLGFVAPPTVPTWTTHVACVHAAHDGTGVLPDFGWDDNYNLRWPRLERVQLATWSSFSGVDARCGLRPGAHILEASSLYRGANAVRPIAADPGDDCGSWHQLDWRDAHTGVSLRVSTDAADVDAVQIDSLRGAAVDWGRPHDGDGLADVILVDPDCAHPVIRRGVALLESGEAQEGRVDETDRVIALASQLGPTRFAQASATTLDAAKKLASRKPRAAKVARAIGVTDGDDRHPHALAQLLERANAAWRRCEIDGCTEYVARRCRYCPTHALTVRREKDRARKRVARCARGEGTS
jgi:hypothetical protein